MFAAFGLCLHTDNQLLSAYRLVNVAGLFVSSFLAGVVLLCLVVLVSAHDGEGRRWSIGIGLSTASVGVVCSLLIEVLPVQVSALGAGVCLGFGLTCLLRQWGRYFRILSYRAALLNTALSFLVGACWWFALEFAGTPFLFSLGLLVLVFCGGLPLLAREIVLADEMREGFISGESPQKPLSTMYQAMRKGWIAVAGILVNFFLTGVMFWSAGIGFNLSMVTSRPLAYLVVFLVVWLLITRINASDNTILVRFYRITLPLAALVMFAGLLAEFFSENAIPVKSIVYLGTAAYTVMGITVLFWTSKDSEISFSKVFAAFCASCALSMAAGMVAFHFIGEGIRLVYLGLLVVYMVAIAIEEVWAWCRPVQTRAVYHNAHPDSIEHKAPDGD